MNEAPTIVEEPLVGAPDRQALRAIDRFLSASPNIERTEFRPDPYHPRLLNAWLTSTTDAADLARLEIYWLTTGDFSVAYYQKDSSGVHCVCRWDRHPHPIAGYCHFHHSSTTVDVESVYLDETRPLDVLRVILASVPSK